MTAVTIDENLTVICELARAADTFAALAEQQESSRDRARPGSPMHHLQAHSATLWRSAEKTLRVRIAELEGC